MRIPPHVILSASYQGCTLLSKLICSQRVYGLCSVEYTDTSEQAVIVKMRIGEGSSPYLSFHAEAAMRISYENTRKSMVGIMPIDDLVGNGLVFLSGQLGSTSNGITISGVKYLGRMEE